MSSGPAAPQRYLVEWYCPTPTAETLEHRASALAEHAAATVDDDSRVTLLMTLLLPTDEVVFGLFAASSSESVARVCRLSGYPAGRLSPAVEAVRS